MTDSRKNGSPPTPQPIMWCVRELLNKRCDSATLYLQKFINPSEKLDELKKICRLADTGKNSVTVGYKPLSLQGMRTFRAVSRSRLLVNHTGGIIENSNLALHRIFGFPVIPGSALKGIARSAAAAVLCEEDKERFARVFGGEKKGDSKLAGSVAFLMALPVDSKWEMEVDVLTSHYGSDTKNPNPVPFLAIKAGAVFEFMIAPTARKVDGDLEFAEKYLKIALAENGVGAKTAAGYGWFEIIGDSVGGQPGEEGGESAEKWVANILDGELLGKLDEVSEKDVEVQKYYISRMIDRKMRRIRAWKRDNNPNYEKIKKMAENCQMELPE